MCQVNNNLSASLRGAQRRGNPEHLTFITRLLRFARNDVSALVCSLLLFLPIVAFSLNSNQQKTAYISSDHSNYNRITHVSTYSGHVHYTQGTSELNADKVVIYDDLKTNKVYKIVAFGDRAEYITLPDGKKEKLHALAKTIEYYPKKNIAILITDAEITQGGETMKGAHITYDITKGTILLKPAAKKRAIITFQP